MTSRQRVQAAIAHRPGDRPPHYISLTSEAWDKHGPATGKTKGELLDNDVIGVVPPWWSWGKLGPEWSAMDTPTAPPPVLGSGNYQEFYERIKRLRNETDKYILCCISGSHFEKAYFARGIENFLADMAGAPDFARELLNTIIEKNMVMLDNFLPVEEIDGVMLGSDWGSQADLLMSPAVWEDMIRPGEQREYDLIHRHGKDVWVHSCGCIEKIIPSLIEMGLDVLNPVQPEAMDIRRLKELYGDKLTFWGGISTQQTLPFGTPDEVRAEARRVRDMMSTDGGFIFAPAQAIQDDVPLENLLALLEVASETPAAASSQ